LKLSDNILSLPEEIEFPTWNIRSRQRAFIYSGELKVEILIDISYDFEACSLIGIFQIEKSKAYQIFGRQNSKIKVDGFITTSFIPRHLRRGDFTSTIADVKIFIQNLRTSKDATIDSMIFPIINSKRLRGTSKISDGNYSYSNGRSNGQIGNYEVCIDNTGEGQIRDDFDIKGPIFEVTSIIKVKSAGIDKATRLLELVNNFGWAYSFAAGIPAHVGITWGIRDGHATYFSIKSVALDKRQEILNWATWLDGLDIINLVSKMTQISDKKRQLTLKIIMSIYYNMKTTIHYQKIL